MTLSETNYYFSRSSIIILRKYAFPLVILIFANFFVAVGTAAHQDKMDSKEKLRIYFVTWNVATKYPDENLDKLLGFSKDGNVTKPLPDLFIVGLQEVKSQPQNVLLNMIFEDPWSKHFRDVLKERDYVKIKTQRMQGLMLNMFCLRRHMTHLRLIEAQYTRTGFGGLWGNKGAVSVRFNLYGVSVCVMNTHLTPHDHLLAERISDYNVILREHNYVVSETPNIFCHDYVFWIGDLNFRLNGEDLTADAIDLLVKGNGLDTLLERDQLSSVRNRGDAFSELNESEITFPPTYKYEFFSQQFDLKRRPSWTDRVLYKVNLGVYEDTELKASQLNYKSHSNYLQSDHKPVTAEFDIVIRPHVEDHGVQFQPLTAWFIDEENSVSFKLLGDTKPSGSDWIGLYQEGFSNLDDYVVYEYIGRDKSIDVLSTTNRIYFSETALKAPGMYVLVYVAQRGDVFGVLGMSPPFPGHSRSR